MTGLSHWFTRFWDLFMSRGIPLFLQNLRNAILFGVACLAFFYLSGLLSKMDEKQYTGKGFLHDLFFWFYYRLGIHTLLFSYWLFKFVGPLLPAWNLLGKWPYW